jgi:GMP synthase-like glutamine amidotransferase
VVVQPPNTRIVATSDFTPFAALAWADRPAISFQFHPEFSPDFAKALIRARHDALPNPGPAIESLDRPNDNELVAGWIRRFLQET